MKREDAKELLLIIQAYAEATYKEIANMVYGYADAMIKESKK